MNSPGSMSVAAALSPVLRWMRLHAVITTLHRHLFIFCWLLLALFALSKFMILPPWTLPGILLLGLLILSFFALVTGIRSISLMDAARLADKKLKLKERVATVHELDLKNDHTEVAEVLRQNVKNHLGTVHPRDLANLSLPSSARWIPLLLAIICVIPFLPDFRTGKQKQALQDGERIKSVGQRMELLSRRIQENPLLLNHPERAEDMKKIDETAQRLSNGNITRQEALRELTQLTDELKRREQLIKSSDAMKPLNREAQRSSDPITPEQLQAMEKTREELNRKVEKVSASDRQLRNMQKALQKAKEGATAAQGSPQQQAALDALNQLQAGMQAAGLSEAMEQIRNAIEAIQSAQVDKALTHIDDAILDLDQTRKTMEAMQQLMKEMKQAGKDLAEQLERGQTQMAQKTIEQMKKNLDAKGLTNDQKKELLQQLTKALNPARDFGELPKHLQEALQNMEKNNAEECSACLARAMDELGKLSDQQGQAQQLAQMINELERAGMMVSMGCQGKDGNDGQCLGLKPGLGNGGKPGSGVGTWPDQGGAPQYTERWNNSGVNRPDKDPRGHTNRGDPQLPQGTEVMKVNGQMGSGGPMPGIQLKGVSIRGESSVQVEESFSSASQEAEEALTKETIPTSYQGTVKEYFDLK